MSTADDAPTIPLTAAAVGKAAASGFEGTIRSNVEAMKAYKRAYMRVWKAQNAERYRPMQCEYTKRSRQRRQELIETLQRELAEAKEKLNSLSQQMALATPQGAAL